MRKGNKLKWAHLIQPVGVKHAKGSTAASGAFLRDRAKVASEFQLLHTLVHGLAVTDALLDSSHGVCNRKKVERYVERSCVSQVTRG